MVRETGAHRRDLCVLLRLYTAGPLLLLGFGDPTSRSSPFGTRYCEVYRVSKRQELEHRCLQLLPLDILQKQVLESVPYGSLVAFTCETRIMNVVITRNIPYDRI